MPDLEVEQTLMRTASADPSCTRWIGTAHWADGVGGATVAHLQPDDSPVLQVVRSGESYLIDVKAAPDG